MKYDQYNSYLKNLEAEVKKNKDRNKIMLNLPARFSLKDKSIKELA
jgi:hypothetical protein